ncbi:MAG: PEFG-CTERM sorting domain-containing protein [Candidatus Nitrosotenuis sp.]
MKFSYVFVLFLIASAPIWYNFAFAEDCKQLCVAKPFYKQGEAVIISGKVEAFLPNTPLLIQIYKETTLVDIAQVDVAQDGTFTHSLIADGPYFKNDGKYTIRASYGVTGNVFETSFDYQTSETGKNPSQIFEVKKPDNSGTFDIAYTINGGTLKDVVVDPAILGLIVTIQADHDGSITLDLGREWIDAKTGPDGKSGDDDKYIIYIDGAGVPYQETTIKPESRLITVQFQEGDSNIEVIGTYVVPEFGPIAILILIVAVSSGITLAKKNSLLRI